MTPDDLASACNDIRIQAKRQKRHAKITRFLVIFFFCLSLLILPCWALYLLVGGIGPGLFVETPTYIYFIIALLVYGIFFIAPFLLCLPVIMPYALQQKNVGRIIVLRKFNDDLSGNALGRIIKSYLSNYGHVFTLSDKNFRVKWYIRIPVFIGQLSLFHFRQRTISKKEDIAKLEKKLSGKIWLNVNWLLSGSKVFSIKTTDAYWKDTALVLLKENRVIVFDISYETTSLEWEFTEIKNLGYGRNIIAITNSEQLLSESQWKNIFDSQEGLSIPVFYYDKKGKLPKKDEFDETVIRILGSSYKMEDLHASKIDFFKRTASTIGVVISFFLFSLFFLSPYLLPDFVGKHSPWGHQVITAYIQSKVQSAFGDRDNQEIILHRINQHWKKEASSVLINYASSHYTAECYAVQSVMVAFTAPENLDKYIELSLTGEPPIADSALSIILTLHPRTLDKIALQLIASERIDAKERALKILEKIPLNADLATGIINAVKKTSQPAKQEPAAHNRPRQLFKSLGLGVDLIITESNFYLALYTLLRQDKNIPDSLLQPLLKNPFIQPRILSSLLLADNNNAKGAGTLVEAALLKGRDRHYLIQFTPDTSYPFRKKADSLLASFSHPTALPGIETFKNLFHHYQFREEDSSTLTHLVVFIVRYYSTADFDAFIHDFPVENINELDNALQYAVANNMQDLQAHLLQVLISSKALLRKNLAAQTPEMKLKTASLLAYSGDLSILPTISIAAKMTKSFPGIPDTYPYAGYVKDIMEILYKNIRAPYDAQAFRDMKNDNNFFGMNAMLDKFIAKAGKK